MSFEKPSPNRLLNKSSLEQPARVPFWVPFVFLLASLTGFVDSTYLTAKHFSGSALECSVFEDCDKVISSRYAVVGGLPLSLYGTAYYLAVFLLTMGYWDLKLDVIMRTAGRVSLAGFVASVFFVYLQIAVIRAICPYCMLSAAASTVLFFSALAIPGAIPFIGRK